MYQNLLKCKLIYMYWNLTRLVLLKRKKKIFNNFKCNQLISVLKSCFEFLVSVTLEWITAAFGRKRYYNFLSRARMIRKSKTRSRELKGSQREPPPEFITNFKETFFVKR